jgi:hypothetical protein
MGSLTEWASSAPGAQFWFVSGLFALFAAVGVAATVTGYRRARIILDIPTARVRSAPQGYVELQGRARANSDPVVRGPLTLRPCVWYDYKVERRRRSGKKTSWQTVRSHCCEESFLLDDGTGRCVIFPEGAAVTPEVDDVWYGNSEIPDRPPAGKSRARSLGGIRVEVSGLGVTRGEYRYTEKRIHDGDALYAMGWFSTVNPGDELPLARETREAIAELKANRRALLQRFDSDHNGEIDIEEWQAARDVVQQEVLAARVLRSAGGVAVSTLMKPPDRRQPYLLSTRPEGELVRHYRTMAWVGGFFVVVFGTLLAWIGNARF